jgi:sulfate transport system substrate-binding protein
LFIERGGDPVEHVTQPQTFKIENPTAVVSKGKGAEKAKAFNDFLFTPAAQELWAQAGFRPVDPTVAAKYAKDFPAPEKLWTIADLGGWKDVDGSLFKKDVGDIAKIYDAATQ